MANKNLFNSRANTTASCNAINNAGGKAYSLVSKAALAQYAMTGCFNNTFYVSDKNQLQNVLELCNKVDAEFIAKLAVYSREQGLMKDMPAVLTAVLSKKDPVLFSKIFNKTINNPKILRTFVQVMRSGAIGRKSLGSKPKKLIQQYLESLTDEQLFKADIGNNPSLKDIIKMVHPKPSSQSRNALYSYLINKNTDSNDLNTIIKVYENFKKNGSGHIPNVPFQMLTSLPLTKDHWKQIASYATWNQVRMNLNTFARHSVFEDNQIVNKLATKLADKNQVLNAKVLPFALYTAYKASHQNVPVEISNALHDAAEHALENIPTFNGKVYVMVDVSGSMQYPITGFSTSRTTCVDVAAVFASAILRKNPSAEVIPFDIDVHINHSLNPRDSIMTNVNKLATFGGGGTSCSKALEYVNNNNSNGDLVIYISDNESWMDSSAYSNSTLTMLEWKKFKSRNPYAKLVNIDIQPNRNTQTPNQKDILNIGGFSDNIFDVIEKFTKFGNNERLWVNLIESVTL